MNKRPLNFKMLYFNYKTSAGVSELDVSWLYLDIHAVDLQPSVGSERLLPKQIKDTGCWSWSVVWHHNHLACSLSKSHMARILDNHISVNFLITIH